jgi:hypothetical protein
MSKVVTCGPEHKLLYMFGCSDVGMSMTSYNLWIRAPHMFYLEKVVLVFFSMLLMRFFPSYHYPHCSLAQGILTEASRLKRFFHIDKYI